MKIKIKKGDATSERPKDYGVIILHVLTQVGLWGAGFVKAVDSLSPLPGITYKALAKVHNNNIPFGNAYLVEVMPGLYVANMIAQHIKPDKNGCLLNYIAFENCLLDAFHKAIRLGCNVHIPAGIGSGIAKGDPERIHQLIYDTAEEVEKKSELSKAVFAATGDRVELDITLWEYADTKSASYIKSKFDNKKQFNTLDEFEDAIED